MLYFLEIKHTVPVVFLAVNRVSVCSTLSAQSRLTTSLHLLGSVSNGVYPLSFSSDDIYQHYDSRAVYMSRSWWGY